MGARVSPCGHGLILQCSEAALTGRGGPKQSVSARHSSDSSAWAYVLYIHIIGIGILDLPVIFFIFDLL